MPLPAPPPATKWRQLTVQEGFSYLNHQAVLGQSPSLQVFNLVVDGTMSILLPTLRICMHLRLRVYILPKIVGVHGNLF